MIPSWFLNDTFAATKWTSKKFNLQFRQTASLANRTEIFNICNYLGTTLIFLQNNNIEEIL